MKVKQKRAIDAGHIALCDGAYVSKLFHDNGQPMFAASGMMLDENGNRSIFDDLDDDGTEDDDDDADGGEADGEIDF